MKEFRLLVQQANMPMPVVYYILGRDSEEAKRLFMLKHPGMFVYEITQVQP